jgi:hypothetical protein
MSNQQTDQKSMQPCRFRCCPKLYLEYSDSQPMVSKESLFIITDDYGGMVKLNIEQLDRLHDEAFKALINYHVTE